MSKKKIAIFIISIVIFIFLAFTYLFGDLSPVDDLFYNFIIGFKTPLSTNILKIITYIGGIYGVIGLMIIVFLINRKKGIYFAINIGIINIINIILKYLFLRHRPDSSLWLVNETGYSFPSGHTMNAIAAYGLIIYYILTSKLAKKYKYLYSCLIVLLMMLIPVSRVYLGVHYFTDILAGTCVSLIWLVFYTEYIKKKDI